MAAAPKSNVKPSVDLMLCILLEQSEFQLLVLILSRISMLSQLVLLLRYGASLTTLDMFKLSPIDAGTPEW